MAASRLRRMAARFAVSDAVIEPVAADRSAYF